MNPTSVSCGSACTVTLVISPMPATQDQYDAASLIFAAALVAAVLIHGAKILYRLFLKPTDA
jgi:hypothetical protein